MDSDCSVGVVMLPSGVLETQDAGDSETALFCVLGTKCRKDTGNTVERRGLVVKIYAETGLLIFIEVDLLFHLLDDDMEDWGEEVAIYFCM